MKKTEQTTDQQVIKRAGKGLAGIVAQISFKLWSEEAFRELIDFDKISQTEQDRIFNEIEVTFLGLFNLYLINLRAQVPKEDHPEMLTDLQVALKEGFLSIYEEMSLPEIFVKQWRTLIDMRFSEYETDFKLFLEESEKIDQLSSKDISLKLKWARVETITMDGWSHIRRGDIDEADLLRKYLQKWVIDLDAIFSESVKNLVFQPLGYS